MVESLANFPGQLFDDGEVKDQLILVQRAFHLDQHTIIMPMQAFALPTKRDEVSRTELEISTFYFYFARNYSFCQCYSPGGTPSFEAKRPVATPLVGVPCNHKSICWKIRTGHPQGVSLLVSPAKIKGYDALLPDILAVTHTNRAYFIVQQR